MQCLALRRGGAVSFRCKVPRHCSTKFVVAAARAFGSSSSGLKCIDLSRYPLDRLDMDEGRHLVEWGRKEMNSTGMLILPGFFSQSGLTAIQEETKTLFAAGIEFRSSEDHNVMLSEDQDIAFADLPLQKSSKCLVAGDQMPAESPLKAMYDTPELMQFMSGIMGSTLCQSVDPMNSVHLNEFGDGDGLGWHHDNSEMFFNMIVQQANEGGEFEYVFDSRDKEEHIRAGVLAAAGVVQRVALQPGCVFIFRGRNSMHRVTPVVGDVPRLSAIFNFASKPGGGLLEEYTRMKFFGRPLA